jgi:hypothetical protein
MVDPSPQGPWQMRKRRNDSRPRAGGNGIICQIGVYGFNVHAARARQIPGLGQANLRLIHGGDAVAERGEMNGVASLAFGQAQHRPGGNLRRDFRHESVGRLAIDMAGNGVTVVPKSSVHGQLRFTWVQSNTEFIRLPERELSQLAADPFAKAGS